MDIKSSILPFKSEPTETAPTRWERWLKRFDNFLIAKAITDDGRKRAMLLHLGGEDVFEISKTHTTGNETYLETKEKLTTYFAPKRNVEYEVFMFRQAAQHPTELLDKYYARLCQLAKNCEFQDKEAEIKSQIIQRCQLVKVRNKGLSEANMTLKALLTFGRTLEATQVQAKAMAGGVETEKTIHVVEHKQKYYQHRKPKYGGKQGGKHKAKPETNNRRCTGCGGCHGTEKRDKVCPAWGKQCHKCKRSNHFASVCKATTPANNMHMIQTETEIPVQSAKAVTIDVDEYGFPLFKSDTLGKYVKPYMCAVTLNGVPVMMEIDTGATTSLMCEEQFGNIKKGNLTLNTDCLPKLRTYSGEIIEHPEGVLDHVDI
ncbi:uncharacterized protein [Antedon mediterranea]|uniref:uncharacterized protein n=1 Tax=Antedon mediterranea TaxID=105859 RepID=UPI003AF99BA1